LSSSILIQTYITTNNIISLIHFQIRSQTLQSTTNNNSSATSISNHVHNNNSPRRITLKHAIEARIVSINIQFSSQS